MFRFDVAARRGLGQHFMADPAAVRRVASFSGVGPGDHVLEIGAGLGSLTLALIETGAAVLAVEVDPVLVGALRRIVADAVGGGTGVGGGRPSRACGPGDGSAVSGIASLSGNAGEVTPGHGIGLRPTGGAARVEIVAGDARSLDYPEVLSGADRWHLVASLPYNIATTLVIDLLEDVPDIETMTVVIQRETAERLAAPPGSRARGIPSVLIERHCTARVLAIIPASVFMPRPSVESAILRIDRHSRRQCADSSVEPSVDCLERLLRKAFGQRRKMLRRSLAGMVNSDAFDRADVDPASRPEMLSLDQWADLAVAVCTP